MTHPDTELRFVSDEVGYGVVANAFIPSGTVVWVRDDLDLCFTQEQVERLAPHYRAIVHKYAYVDVAGVHVLCWDFARYFNHSCDSSCLGGASDFEIAVHDLHPGDELTDDYATFNLESPEAFECRCGSPRCRGTVSPVDALRLRDGWAQTFQAALALAPAVAQPLSPFFPEHGMPELEALRGR